MMWARWVTRSTTAFAGRGSLNTLCVPLNAEGTTAVTWLSSAFDAPTSTAARTLEQHMKDEHGISGGGDWAVRIARRFEELLASTA